MLGRHRQHAARSRPVGGVAACAAVVALFAIACASPTLPLPPPSIPIQEVGPDADHIRLVSACGGAVAGALVLVVNENVTGANAGVASLADGCGAWQAVIFAHKGDLLRITQEVELTGSLPEEVLVR